MNKILRVLLLSIMAVLLSISMTFAATYHVDVVDDSEINEPTLFEEYEDIYWYEGYNYSVKYQLPGIVVYDEEDTAVDSEVTVGSNVLVRYELSWDIAPVSEDYDFITPRFSDDVLVLNGILPNSADEYHFTLTGKVTSGDTYISAEPVSFDISIEVGEFDEDWELWESDTGDEVQQFIFKNIISHDESTDINIVTPKYLVKVIAPDTEGYAAYINSLDINLPEWLQFEVTSQDNDNDEGEYGVTAISLKFKEGSIVANSTDAVVRIPLTEADDDNSTVRVLGWNVTFESKDATPPSTPIGLSKNELSFTFTSTNVQSQEITYAGLAPISWDITYGTANVATITVVSEEISPDESGKITVTVTPSTPLYTPGTYSADIKFVDSEDHSATLSVKIETKQPSPEIINRSFDICSKDGTVIGTSIITLDLVAGGETKSLDLKASGDKLTNLIRWKVSYDVKGLKIEPSSTDISSDQTVTFTFSADSTASADAYTVKITAVLLSDDASELQENSTVELKVNIKPEDTSEPHYENNSFDIVYNGSIVTDVVTVTVTAGSSNSATFKISGDVEGIMRWTVSNDNSGLNITPSSSDISSDKSITFTISPESTLTAGNYDVQIDAELLPPEINSSAFWSSIVKEPGKSAYAALTVKVTSQDNSGGNGGNGGNNGNNNNDNNNEDNTNNTDRNTGEAYTPTVSDFKFNDTTALNNLRSIFPNATPKDIVGNSTMYEEGRTTVKDGEYVAGYEAVLVLPIYQVNESGVYLIKIDVPTLINVLTNSFDVTGSDDDVVDVFANVSEYNDYKPSSVNSSFFYASASTGAVLVNNNGELVQNVADVNADDGLNIAASLEANKYYSPSVVTGSASSTLGAANVGCNAGLSVLGLTLLFAPLLAKRKKDHRA